MPFAHFHCSLLISHCSLFFDLPVFAFFEFGGVFECLVYDVALASCHFGFFVFDDEQAVMFA